MFHFRIAGILLSLWLCYLFKQKQIHKSILTILVLIHNKQQLAETHFLEGLRMAINFGPASQQLEFQSLDIYFSSNYEFSNPCSSKNLLIHLKFARWKLSKGLEGRSLLDFEKVMFLWKNRIYSQEETVNWESLIDWKKMHETGFYQNYIFLDQLKAPSQAQTQGYVGAPTHLLKTSTCKGLTCINLAVLHFPISARKNKIHSVKYRMYRALKAIQKQPTEYCR